MSLPWLKDDYKRPSQEHSRSRSRSRSSSRGRRSRTDSLRRSKSRSRSRSRSSGRDRNRRGGYFGNVKRRPNRGRGGGKGGGRGKRRRSNSSSSGSQSSPSRSPTRPVASDRPTYVEARVFVANILSKDVTKAELASKFEKYGNVIDVLIHSKNYAFIQYLKAEDAKLAVEGEDGTIFKNMRINVKMANQNRKERDNNKGRGGSMGDGPDRGALVDPLMDTFGPDPYTRGRMPYPPPLPGDPRDPYFPDPYRRPYPPDPWLGDPYRRDPYSEPFRDPYAPRAPPPPTECVVFYVNRQLQTYAESIERRVKEQSIIAISTILPEGRTAPQMIDDLSTRNGLFAIFVNAQNELHRSLTLNILHGTPQEHRNMPLDDAITLIGRSFEKYVEELRAKAEKKTESAVAPSVTPAVASSQPTLPQSSEIKYLLNLLADNQVLTVPELDSVIQYLQERRDRLIAPGKDPMPSKESSRGYDSRDMERGNVNTSYDKELHYESGNQPAKRYNEQPREERQPPADKSKPIHEELSKKILSIFNGTDPSKAPPQSPYSSAPHVTAPGPTPAPAPAPPPAPSSTPSSANLINFDNPNVQKALDNLIQSGPNLLKSINPKMSSDTTSLATSSMASSSDYPGARDSQKGQQGAGGMGSMMGQHGGMGMGNNMMDPQMGMDNNMMDQQMRQHGGMGMAPNLMDLQMGMGNNMGGQQRGMPHGNNMMNPQMGGPRMGMGMQGPMQMAQLVMQGLGFAGGFGAPPHQDSGPRPPLPRGAPPPPPPSQNY